MKTRCFYIFLMLFPAVLIAVNGCRGDKDDAGLLVDDFIPDISNVWKDPSGNRFLFAAAEANVPSGTFTGQEIDNDNSTYDFNGAFEHEKIHFTYTSGSKSGITYKGVIDTLQPTRMLLANTANPLHDSLLLKKQQ